MFDTPRWLEEQRRVVGLSLVNERSEAITESQNLFRRCIVGRKLDLVIRSYTVIVVAQVALHRSKLRIRLLYELFLCFREIGGSRLRAKADP